MQETMITDIDFSNFSNFIFKKIVKEEKEIEDNLSEKSCYRRDRPRWHWYR